MLEGVLAGKTVARSLEVALWSVVGAVGLYLVTALVVLIFGLVSLLAGWYVFVIETGPVGFLGYTMSLDSGTDPYVLIEPRLVIEPSLLGIIGLAVAVSLLMGAVSSARALRTSR